MTHSRLFIHDHGALLKNWHPKNGHKNFSILSGKMIVSTELQLFLAGVCRRMVSMKSENKLKVLKEITLIFF